eukprot:CAMPEP_0171498864 /NCGR_PEP_ID=MMETSP0958-20121227/8095_1 /TAXON_ID=87120 /ORGANISM="Aurantiochytrium limacinum, Strain ATCCMYA-1381" /LENGTH=220 /DNA_ID=CAMNT_0012033327 /DNA_START=253 /DNA_END=915 /DNA_ORIENTATION=+
MRDHASDSSMHMENHRGDLELNLNFSRQQQQFQQEEQNCRDARVEEDGVKHKRWTALRKGMHSRGQQRKQNENQGNRKHQLKTNFEDLPMSPVMALSPTLELYKAQFEAALAQSVDQENQRRLANHIVKETSDGGIRWEQDDDEDDDAEDYVLDFTACGDIKLPDDDVDLAAEKHFSLDLADKSSARRGRVHAIRPSVVAPLVSKTRRSSPRRIRAALHL